MKIQLLGSPLKACCIAMTCVAYLNAEQIKIDGNVTDSEWANAQQFDLEYEVVPARNAPARLKTTAFLKFDSEFLYIAFKAYGDPSKVRATIKDRDTAWREDYVALMADPYGDGRYGILVGLNAMGSRLDEKHTSSSEPDASWNIVYEAEAMITSYGYSAELAIPFSELQFPEKKVQEWRIGFLRKSFEPGLETVFSSYKNEPGENCYACQADEIISLGSPAIQKRNYIYPYIFLNQDGTRPEKDLEFQNPNYEIGISGLIDLSKSASLEYTINPDFSQVESDAPVIMANQTFATSYPEKRTFFLEGSELLKSDLGSVYTRSINAPLGAVKYINQGESNSLYFMQATDAISPYLAAGEYGSYQGNAGKSKVTIGRIKRNLPNQSNVGILYTNRDYHSGGHGSLLEIDGLINFLEDFRVDLNFARSETQEGRINFLDTNDTFGGKTYAMDGEKFSGTAKNIRLRHIVEGSYSGIRYKDVSPTYRSSVGLVSKNNYKERNYWHGRTFRYEGSLRKISLHASKQNRLNYQGQKTRERLELKLNAETSLNLKGELEFVTKASEIFEGQRFGQQDEIKLAVQFSPSETFTLGYRYEVGDQIAYNINTPVIGDQKTQNISAGIKFSDALRMNLQQRFTELRSKTTNEEFYGGEINRFELDYQFGNALSSRLIVEKNDFQDNYYLEGLMQWKPDPYTIFYIGGTQYYKKPNPFSDNLRMETSQIYLKFQYFYNPNS
ncbi:carbohydrate binding family 9 domain-containing protein [Gammaproteobacteria bacterium]|nr:carbohydrate binding family 9 domain-containing protein [Gammaproteobacteria bacterium]